MRRINPEMQNRLNLVVGMMPNNVEKLAKMFYKQGIEAVCNNARSCAIAQYIKENMNLAQDEVPVIHDGGIHIKRDSAIIAHKHLTASQSTFISKFDSGEFPEITKSTSWKPRNRFSGLTIEQARAKRLEVYKTPESNS